MERWLIGLLLLSSGLLGLWSAERAALLRGAWAAHSLRQQAAAILPRLEEESNAPAGPP
jgi:hypothetical protein